MNAFSPTKGFVLAAAASGIGKTTVAAALCRALSDSGYTVQPFKVGPDYVDKTYLTIAAGRTCRNLDGFPNPKLIPYFYSEGCRAGGQSADIAVIEGVMGMYDGLGAEGLYSTAWIAGELGLPIILLVDARASATSTAAVVKGFASLHQHSPQICGVIANRVSGESHAALISEALDMYTGIPLIGWLPNVHDLSIPSRHLGLIPANERSTTDETLSKFASVLMEHLSIERVVKSAALPHAYCSEPELPCPIAPRNGRKPLVAIGEDDSFCFNYVENTELLHKLGAETVTTSPLSDKRLPDDIDLLILPGGYPEEFGEALSDNISYINSVREFASHGTIYAECGGMLYLSEGIEHRGMFHPMTGVIAARGIMTDKLQRFGYVFADATRDNLLFKSGERVSAHEFHYSRLEGLAHDLFSVSRASGRGTGWFDGVAGENLLATYLHLNFYSCPNALRRMLLNASGMR